jgi:hypothetical protein
MSAKVRIGARFNGPPDSGNGGYAAGCFAIAAGATVNVRLYQPVPLERDLLVATVGEGQWEFRDQSQRIASAVRTEVELDVPEPVSYIEARGVSTHYVGFHRHLYPTCFVCGPQRQPGDGLRIFAGAVPGTKLVAAPWLPDRSLDDGMGKVRPEFIWAALDCPGYFARATDEPPNQRLALLGELAVHIDRTVHVDEPCVIIGWPIRQDGRKHYVGTALFDEDGERCAVGAATWITVE